MGRGGCILSLVSFALCAEPAFAAEDHRTSQYDETRRTAFAGAVFRLEMGPGAKPPATRLQMGLRSLSSGRHSEAPPRIAHVPLFELGVAGKGKPEMFVGGRSVREMRERMNLTSSTPNTVWIIMGVVLVAVTILVVSGLDDLGDSIPEFAN